MELLIPLAVIAVVVMILGFFVACVAPGSIVENFRKFLRFVAVLFLVCVVAVIGLVIFAAFRQEQLTNQQQQVAVAAQVQEERERIKNERIEKEKTEKERIEKEKVRLEESAATERLERERKAAQEAREQALAEQKQAEEQAKWRDWTIDGKVVRAKFVKYMVGVAFLDLENGDRIHVKAASLGPADKRWIEAKWKKE